MYKHFIRPLLFLVPPEIVHNHVVFWLKVILAIPGKRFFFRKMFSFENKKLERNLFGLKFKNPVGLAAGFDKNAVCFNYMSVFGFSFVEIGTITPEPQPGNPKPRVFRLPSDLALINRMGLNNDGVKKAVSRLKGKNKNLIVGGNIGKNTFTPDEESLADYILTFSELYDYVDYFTVNLSCPNVGNISRLQEPEFQIMLFTELKKIDNQRGGNKPVFIKIAPELTEIQIDEIINLVQKTGITGIVASNTTKERENLKSNLTQINRIGAGGLSGKPLKNRSTEIIRYISQKTNGKMPVIGVGGVMSPEDAIEKIEAGACLIQLYTGFIYKGPSVVKRINKAILTRAD